MREDLELLLPNADPRIIEIYIRKAIALIVNYLNRPLTPQEVQVLYPEAIIDIVVNAYNLKDSSNIKSKTQGARSVTYADNTAFCITDSVAALLPSPYIRMW